MNQQQVNKTNRNTLAKSNRKICTKRNARKT